jgi:ferrous iron transport protein B
MEDLLGAVDGADVSSMVAAGKYFFTSSLAGFSFLVFNLLCAPCIGAIGAIRREMNDWKWSAFTVIYMCVFAYLTSFCIYNIGVLFDATFFWWEPILALIAFAIIGVVVYLLVRKNPYEARNNLK